MGVQNKLMSIRRFQLYFLGSSVSNLGNGMQFVANAWLALQFTGKASSVGWTLALTMLPNILLSPFICKIIRKDKTTSQQYENRSPPEEQVLYAFIFK